jgi:hypothetical protein
MCVRGVRVEGESIEYCADDKSSVDLVEMVHQFREVSRPIHQV